MTMTFMIRFRTLPGVGVKASPISLWASYPTMDSPSIYITGLSATTARVDVGSLWNTGTSNVTNNYGCISPPMTTTGPVINVNETYLITLNAIRSNEGDVKTLSALKVGAARLSDLQKDPGSIKYSEPLVWPNKNNLDDPNSTTAAYMVIKSDGGFIQRNWTTDFDLFHIQMYDYILGGENMKHAAKGDWAIIPPNIYT